MDEADLLEDQCTSVNRLLEEFDDWTLRLDVKITYSIVYGCIFIVGLLGNGLLIENIVRRKRYYSVPNLFLLNLAISDVLLCITALPITPVLAFLKEWLFGELMCKLVPLCQATSVLISSYCLCFIALDRYRNIVTTTKEPWNLRSASILMAFSWVASVLVSGPLFLSQQLDGVNLNNITICGVFCGEYNWPNHYTKVGYGFLLLGVQFLIPVSMMCFCYWKILQKVRQDWIVTEGSMLTQAQQAQASVRKRRVMYVLILMVVAFVGSWLPLTIVNLLRDFNLNIAFLNKQMYFSLLNVHAIAMTSIVWNPMLYFWMSKRHRRALKHDMFWFTNARRGTSGLDMGMLHRCAPSPSVTIVYKRSLASSNTNHSNNQKLYNGHNSSGRANKMSNSSAHYCRRGTLADPTYLRQEQAINQIHASCFLLVPLMPSVSPSAKNGYKPTALIKNKKAGYLPMGLKKNTATGSIQKLLRPG